MELKASLVLLLFISRAASSLPAQTWEHCYSLLKMLLILLSVALLALSSVQSAPRGRQKRVASSTFDSPQGWRRAFQLGWRTD